MTKVLRCAEDLDPFILYAIWSRIVEENLMQGGSSAQDVEWLRESQFHMACKLVAIYQQSQGKIFEMSGLDQSKD